MFHGWSHLTPADRETILRGVETGGCFGGPYHLELDWVERCNARCFFCVSDASADRPSLTFEQTERLIDDATRGDLRSVRLSGGGEPMLHPQFADLLDLLRERGVAIENLNTNGILLTPEAVERLMTLPVDHVRLSLNYCDAALYARAMGLSEKTFERVCDQTAHLIRAGRECETFGEVSVQFFVYRDTVDQIGRMYELGRRLGADLIYLRDLSGIAPALQYGRDDVPRLVDQLREVLRADWPEGRVECALERGGVTRALARLQGELAEELGPGGRGVGLELLEGMDLSNRYCYIPWYSAAIMGSGAVHPCCMMASADWPPLGDLAHESMASIWRGAGYRRLRHEMRRYMLLQRPVPGARRRDRRIMPACASHRACVLTPGMCDAAFYDEGDRRLARVRRRLTIRGWRWANYRAVGLSGTRVFRGLKRVFRSTFARR